MAAPIGPNTTSIPPSSAPKPQVSAPLVQSAAAPSEPSPSSQEEKIQHATMKAQHLQMKIWLKTLPPVLQPLQLPSAAAQIKLCDLMTFLRVTTFHDVLYHIFWGQNKDTDSLAIDPYDPEINLKLATLLSRETENLETKKMLFAFQNLMCAMKFMKATGSEGRTDQTLTQLLEPADLTKIFCPPEQDNSFCLNYLNSYKRWVCHTLHWAHRDFVAVVDTIRETWTKREKHQQFNSELDKAEILLKSFHKNKRDVEKLLKLLQFSFSSSTCINPGATRFLLESFKRALYYVERDILNAKNFLDELSSTNPFSIQNMEKDLSKQLPSELLSMIRGQFDEAWEKRKEAMLNAMIGEFKLQNKRPVEQEMFIHKMTAIKEAAPDIERACQSLQDKWNHLAMMNPFYALLKAKVSTLIVEGEDLARQAGESIFNEEQPRKEVVEKASQETVDLLEEIEEEEPEPLQATPSLPAKPSSSWQHLHSQLLALKAIEQWRTESTKPEMAETSRFCMRHAAFHFSLLHAQLRLMIKARDANQVHLIPLFSRMLARSCSLITEQLLTAQLSMRNNAAKLNHYHLTLANGQIPPKDESWTLFQALDGGEIFHRYPHQFAKRCKAQNLAVPLALQWILEPRSCSYRELFHLAEDTMSFIGKVLPGVETKGLMAELSEKNPPSPFSDHFRNTLNPVLRTLDTCMNKAEQIIQRCGVSESSHWRDVHAQLQGLQLGLSCLIEFPHAETLSAIGDSLLAQAQYLDELIENGQFQRTTGYLLETHDLEAFRLIKNPPPDDAELQLIADLNGEDGTHYPHRYIQNEGRVPKTLKWRFDAARFAIPSKDFDREALEQENDRIAGFKQVKGGKTEDRHPLFGLHEDLFRLIGGIADLSDRRLTELLK